MHNKLNMAKTSHLIMILNDLVSGTGQDKNGCGGGFSQ